MSRHQIASAILNLNKIGPSLGRDEQGSTLAPSKLSAELYLQ